MVEGNVLRGLWLCLLVAAGAFDCAAEMRLDRCRHRFWKVAEGLPDNEVQTLLQDHSGYLWIGTRSGLARFDGDQFTIFDHLNTPELEDDDIIALAEDGAGTLWIGARQSVIRKRGSEFERWILHEGDGEINVKGICAASDGSVWVCQPPYLVRVESDCIQSIDTRELIETHALYEWPTGTLWLGGLGGAYSYDLRSGKSHLSFVHAERPSGCVNGFALDARDQLWLWCNEGPDPNTGVFHAFVADKWVRRQPYLVMNGGRKIFAAGRYDGSLWQPGTDGHIAQWTDKRTEYLLPFAGFALCALEDREHNLWIGAESGGLHCFYSSTIQVVTTADGLVDDNTWTVMQSRDGTVWIGTELGLTQLDPEGPRSFTEKEGLTRNEIRALAEDQAGRIWVGTGAGLNCFDRGGLRRYQFAGDWANTKIRTLLAGPDNHLWVGTPRGLYAVDLSLLTAGAAQAEAQVLEPTLFLDKATGLADDIRTLHLDQSGALWIGSFGGGLHRWQNGLIQHFGSREGIHSDRVWALHESADGTLWIGTEGGLYRHRRGAFVAFTRKQGLWDNVINEILEDDDGWLWLGSDNGIHAVRLGDLEAVANGQLAKVECDLFSESDGLLSRETNGQKSQPAGWKAQDGKLWFPTTRGVAVIDPPQVRKDRMLPPTVIEQVRANGRVVHGDNDEVPSSARFDSSGEELHRLPAGQGDVVEIRYTANHFLAPEQLRFRYRLMGLDPAWTDAGNRRFAYYAHLSPGKYRFEVMAGTQHNVWDKQGASFDFVIAPHLRETWGFRAGALAAIGLAVFGIFRWRLHEEREKQKLKETAALAQERSRIARNLHDEFGASLTAIRMLADLVQREADSVRTSTHLQKMSQAVIDTGQTLRQIIWTNHPTDESWRGLINRIHQYGEEFLGAAEIQCLFEETGQPSPLPVSPSLRLELFRATKEAFHNVAKHAQANAVKLNVYYKNGLVTLTIEDDGKGFDYEAQRHKSYGMTNMLSRVSQVGGRLEVISTIGRGTRISMYLPTHQENSSARPRWWKRLGSVFSS